MTGSSNGTWGRRVLIVGFGLSVSLLLLAADDVGDEILVSVSPLTSSAPQLTTSMAPAATTTTVPATTTSVPDLEALIPLSAEGVADQVAPSVGFVLSQQATGSGVVISDELLITNAHVVWPDSTVGLVFLNGATYQGRVLAIDPFVDLAVVDISGLSRKPPPISIGTTADIEAADDLWVVGYPAPTEFTPEPTIDSGELVGFSDWEFTGVRWFSIGAPAIGGQSGGAVVDQYGRLVGISTFGSSAMLSSISVDDVVSHLDDLLASSAVRGIERRKIPHAGARRSNDIELEGEWDQQLLAGWFRGDADVGLEWSNGDVELSAISIDGSELGAARNRLDFTPQFAFPVLVAVQADTPVEGTLSSSLPLILYPDLDHGKTLPIQGSVSGIYDNGGDRDFFYLDLSEGDSTSVLVESAARTTLLIYDPDGAVVAEDVDNSGFIGNNAEVEFVVVSTGRHVVSVQSRLSTISGYTIVTQ